MINTNVSSEKTRPCILSGYDIIALPALAIASGFRKKSAGIIFLNIDVARSATITDDYQEEFEKIFEVDSFGLDTSSKIPYPMISLDDSFMGLDF